jgi:hypothetical protein
MMRADNCALLIFIRLTHVQEDGSLSFTDTIRIERIDFPYLSLHRLEELWETLSHLCPCLPAYCRNPVPAQPMHCLRG